MPILPFGEWKPDITDYSGASSGTIQNVFARGDGYGPVKSFSAYSEALAGACRGAFVARKSDGTVAIFAGTGDKLWLLNNSDGSWDDVSRSGDYTPLSNSASWQFRQFNDFVFATQVNDVVQVFDLASPATFDDLGGSPPQAAYIAIVNRFVVLSGLAVPDVYRIQWSGLNDPTEWNSGVNSSDFQDLPDGGSVLGVAGGEFGTVFQERSIRRLIYSPGSPYIFGIQRIVQDDGLFAPGSLVVAGDRVFFASPQGFKMLLPGSSPLPIGKEKIDRTFLADVDNSALGLIVGASDPRQTRVYWSYKSNDGGSANLFDKILCYDWMLERWTVIGASGEYLLPLAQPGYTLESLDAVYGSNIDTISLGSFDDVATVSRSVLGGANSAHKIGFYSGPNLEATLETAEQGLMGSRVRVRGFRPICDAVEFFGSVSRRETKQAAATYSTETEVNAIGTCPANVSTRYAKAKLRIPAGEDWEYAVGVEPDFGMEGKR